MEKMYLGIVGPIGSGKDTIGSYLEIYENANVLVSSELLGSILSLINLDPDDRTNLQKLPILLKSGFGESVITNAMIQRMKRERKHIVAWNGVRYPCDVAGIKSLPNSHIIGVTADKNLCYKRIKERKQKAGEENITMEEFEKQLNQPTEILINHILRHDTTFTIENNGSIDDLHKQLTVIVETLRSKP